MSSSSAARHRYFLRTRRQPIAPLPDEIIEVILSKCPVKSAVRFKSVSKSWLSIISNPRISRFHRIQQSKNQNKFFILQSQKSNIFLLHPITLEDGKIRSESVLTNTFDCGAHKMCSCNGLILLLTDYNAMLWNPFIRKQLIVPGFIRDVEPTPLRIQLYFDSINDDYKIVFLYRGFYKVYSCNSGGSSWGVRHYPRGWNPYRIECCVSVDGCLYEPYDKEGEVKWFDARDGKMQKLRQPEEVEDLGLYRVQLRGAGGRLCLYGFSDCGGRKLQLWVMEENGSFHKCWRKIISMENKEPHTRNMRPLCLNNQDNVLLSSPNRNTFKHIVYNPRSNRSCFKQVDFPWGVHPDIFPYAENLYMPDS